MCGGFSNNTRGSQVTRQEMIRDNWHLIERTRWLTRGWKVSSRLYLINRHAIVTNRTHIPILQLSRSQMQRHDFHSCVTGRPRLTTSWTTTTIPFSRSITWTLSASISSVSGSSARSRTTSGRLRTVSVSTTVSSFVSLGCVFISRRGLFDNYKISK